MKKQKKQKNRLWMERNKGGGVGERLGWWMVMEVGRGRPRRGGATTTRLEFHRDRLFRLEFNSDIVYNYRVYV